MEGDSNAVKSSGKTVAVSAKNESTLIENADVMAELMSQLHHALIFVTQYIMLACVLRLMYKGKEQLLLEDHPYLMKLSSCSFLAFVLMWIVLLVNHCVTTSTNKFGAFQTILNRVCRFASYVAFLSLIVILIDEFMIKG